MGKSGSPKERKSDFRGLGSFRRVRRGETNTNEREEKVEPTELVGSGVQCRRRRMGWDRDEVSGRRCEFVAVEWSEVAGVGGRRPGERPAGSVAHRKPKAPIPAPRTLTRGAGGQGGPVPGRVRRAGPGCWLAPVRTYGTCQWQWQAVGAHPSISEGGSQDSRAPDLCLSGTTDRPARAGPAPGSTYSTAVTGRAPSVRLSRIPAAAVPPLRSCQRPHHTTRPPQR